MRWEHRPPYLKRLKSAADDAFARHFLHPHFDAVGRETRFQNPYWVAVLGPRVELGSRVEIIANSDQKVRLSVWPVEPGLGRIRIGDYSVINPGVRINSGCAVDIGDNALLAANVYISDTDWHGLYDRVYSYGQYAPVRLGNNVWVGEAAMITKGVTIGTNCVIGAGAVVVSDIPDNTVAAGNPARVVRHLDPEGGFISRDHVFSDDRYLAELRRIERELGEHNSFLGWLRYLLMPTDND